MEIGNIDATGITLELLEPTKHLKVEMLSEDEHVRQNSKVYKSKKVRIKWEI